MTEPEPHAYPWHSESVFVAELDSAGAIVRANPALAYGTGLDGEGVRFDEAIASEQRSAFTQWVAALGDGWEQATYGFFDGRSASAEDRCLWLRRLADGGVEVVAEPAWREYDRLVEQMLELNEELIGTQRGLARRQRELERAQDEAAASARRIRQLEAIVLAALTPADFDEAAASLLDIAREVLPGERAEILLLDESGSTLTVRASTDASGVRPPERRRRIRVAPDGLGGIATSGRSVLIEDLASSRWTAEGLDGGSLIATPLRVEGAVTGVLAVSAASPRAFSDDDLRLLELLGERVALAIEQTQSATAGTASLRP